MPLATGWRVEESVASQGYDYITASRTYHVFWDGDGSDPIPPKTPFEAREQIYTWLNERQQSKADLTISEINTLDRSTHWKLTESLYGLPTSNLSCDEIEGTNGRVFVAVAKYGNPTSSTANFARASANSGQGDKGTDDPATPVEVTHSLSAGVTGSSIDMSPRLRWLLVGDFKKARPPFALGSINPEQRGQVADDAPVSQIAVDVQGLDYSSPPVNRGFTLTYPGDVLASQIKLWADAADEGTVNSKHFQLQGSVYKPLELCFCKFDVTRSPTGSTTLTFGFSTGKRKVLKLFEDDTEDPPLYSANVAGVLAGYNTPTRVPTVSEYDPDSDSGEPLFPVQSRDSRDDDTADDPTGTKYLWIGGFDYIDPFSVTTTYLAADLDEAQKANQEITLDANGNQVVARSEVAYYQNHVLWPEVDYYSLFGPIDAVDTTQAGNS